MNVALLLSGGVDSAVAGELLLRQGHSVHAFYIRIGREDGADGSHCASEEDLEMCTALTRRWGVQLDVIDLHREYWDYVMAYALDSVKRGLTPNPDVMCNSIVKFGYFEQRVGHAFDATATGHYAAKIIDADGTHWLATAPDPVKDQTDFLARLTYEQLRHAMFPLGELRKSRVREMAAEFRLPNAARRDSQGICFIGKVDYTAFLRERLGERPGPIVEVETGRVIGEHRGYWFHTIGQRRGLGLSGGPWFVVDKDVEANTVYVSRGYDTALQYGTQLPLAEMHWITRAPAEQGPMQVAFKNRHTPDFTPGRLEPAGADGRRLLTSERPVQGIAPGQFAVIYDKECRRCLGSGVITTKSHSA